MSINKIIIFVLVSLLSLCAVSTKGQQESIIVGSGFLKNDLIHPYNIQVTDSKIFLLDFNWIKVFENKTNRFLKQIDLRKYCQNDNPVDWKDVFVSDLMGVNYYNLLPNQFSIPPSSEAKYWHSLYLDDKENCIILGEGYIYIIDSNSENLLRTIDLFSILPKLSTTNLFQVSMCVVENYIYILYKRAYDPAFDQEYEFSIFQIDFNGICHKKSLLMNEDLELKVNKFTFLPDLQLFLIPNEKPYRTKKEEKLELVFFNQEGKIVPFNQGNQYIDVEQIVNLSPNYFAIYGSVISKDLTTMQRVIKKYHYSYSSSNEIIINENYSIDVSKFFALDIKSYQEDFYLINKTERFLPTIYKINQFEKTLIFESGKTKGQIFSSFGFTLDNQLHLIQSNIGNQMINWFSLNRDLINSKKLDFYVRDIEFDEFNHLILLSESYIGDQIFSFNKNSEITSLLDIQILKKISPYKIINLYCNNNDLYALIQIKDPKYYYEPGVIPIIYLLIGKKNQINVYEWNLERFDYPLKIKNTFPITIDFKISNNQYIFLDSENSCLYLYDMTTGMFNRTISLPTQDNTLYTSLSIYPDGTYLLSDILQCCLIHVDQEGHLLETIGSKGQIEIGTTKEAYLEKPDQFYFPIRAKIQQNRIIVSDLYNWRYHIIPIEPFQMNWQESSIQKKAFSIFSSESGSLHYDVSSPSVLTYQVTSSVPWLEIQHPTGSLSDKQIEYQILGDKLTPWQTHQGVIQITFPEQWSFLNKTIPVTVTAIGSTVELTIGSNIAKVDSKWITLESGYVPVIKQGRTCIGLRFLTEYLFRSHASIEYEASLQRIKVTTKDHSIYMIIQHPIASVDGKPVSLDVPPFIQQGRTMIPLRFVSESLEAEVSWEASTQKVTISYPRRKK